MNEIIFEILKVVVMVTVLVFFRYIIPLVKEAIGARKLNEVKMWAESAVLMAQQVYWDKTGAERKAIVIDMLKELLEAKNLAISDEQLDMLIEAAVKTMKIEEGKGIKIEAVDQWEPGEGENVADESTDDESAVDKAE